MVHAPLALSVRASSSHRPNACTCMCQDDAKEQFTTEELLTRVPLDEILAAKKEDEDEKKLKASLTRHLHKTSDQWDE